MVSRLCCILLGDKVRDWRERALTVWIAQTAEIETAFTLRTGGAGRGRTRMATLPL
jgi:hypothetical protein